MNESGVVVKEQLEKEPDRFVVVCDDLALPFGRLRLRPKGSDGGHKGLGSVIYHLGRTDFARLRIGIDAPGTGKDGIDYVLERFPKEQEERLPEVLDRAADACLTMLTAGLELAMNRFNPLPGEPDPDQIGSRQSEIGDSP
jgi:PTH1 family peptidyl-tRNA hydrolase